jgi:hypothetical protein
MTTRENGPPLVSIPLAEYQLLVESYKRAVAQERAPAVTDDELFSLGERAVRGYLDFDEARKWFADWRAPRRE